MNNEKIKCGLYVRVSSRNQVDKEYNSLESQREKLEAYCKSQEDFQVYRVYEDGAFSGENMDRPALQAMLQDIRLGKINKVMVYKLDRLTRSRRDFERIYEICQKPNVAILSITQSYDTSTPSGRLLRNLIVEFSQYERDMIADRTRDKMLQRAEKGMWNGGNAPFGYKVENKKLIPHPEESSIVQLIFQQYSKEASQAKVRELLRLRGHKFRNGKDWDKGTIFHILNNPIYCGKIRYKDQIFQGEHEPLIEESLFTRAESLSPQRTHTKTKLEKAFLLKGLIRCPDCGAMTPHYTQKRRKDGTPSRIYYYRCSKTMHFDNSVCKLKSVNADEVESFVIRSLSEISHNEAYVDETLATLNANLKVKTAHKEKETESLKGRLGELDGQIDRYVKAIGEGSISVHLMEKQIKGLMEDKKKIESQLETLEQDINKKVFEEFDVKLVKQSLKRFRDSFESLGTEEKTETIQTLLQSVLVQPNKITLEVYELPVFPSGSQKRLKWLPGLDSNRSVLCFKFFHSKPLANRPYPKTKKP